MKTFFHNSGRKTNKFWIVPFLLLIFGLNTAVAQRVASVSGNWGDSATWGGLAPPTAAQTATINAGINVTVNVAATTSSLTVNGTLNVTGGNIAISNGGSVTNNSGGSIVFNATNVINGGSNGSNGILIAINTGSSLTTAHVNGFNNNTGSFQHNPGNRGQTYSAGANYTYNGATQNTGADFPTNLTGILTINSSATVSLTGTRTIANGGSIALTSGTFATGTSLTMASTSSISRSGGNITGTLQGTGVYNLTYTGNSKTSGPEAANTGLTNVTINLTAAQTLTWNSTGVAPDGNLSVSAGILDLGSNLINRSAAGGTLTVSNGATLIIGGTNTFPTNYTTHSIGSTSTVEYSGTTQTLAVLNSSQNYGNLTLRGSATKTAAGAITASGTTTVNSGVIFATGATFTANGAVALNGTFQINQGGFGGGTGTWTYGSNTNLIYNYTQTTTYGPVDAAHKYWPATSGPTNVTLQMQNSNSINAGNLQMGVARTITGALTTSNANGRTMTFDLNGNNFQSATLTVGTTAPLTLLSSAVTTVTGNVNINANFAINGDLNVGGSWTKSSSAITFTPNSRAVFFNSASLQTIAITGGGTETFAYFVISGAGGVQLSSSPATSVTVNGASGSVLQLNAAGGLDINGQTFTVSGGGNLALNTGARSITSTATGGSFTVTGGTLSVTSGGTLSFASNVTVRLSNGMNFGAGITTINGTLQINSGGFVSASAAPIYANGSTLNLNSGGTYSLYDNTASNESAGWFRSVASTGSAQQGIPWNFTITNATAVNWNSTGGDAFARYINGNFTITSGSFAMSTTSNGNLFIRGNFSSSGTFTNNGRVVTLDGTALQTITGATTFTDFTANNTSGGITLANDITVTGTLTFTSGIITTSTNRVIVGSAGSAGTISRTSGHVNGNLRRFVPNSAAPTVLYAIGDATNYTPASIAFVGTTSGSGYLDASTSVTAPVSGNIPTGAALSATNYINRRWVMANTGVAGFTSYSPTFTFVAGDVLGGANTSALEIRTLNGSTWATTNGNSSTATTTSCTGLTTFDQYASGETCNVVSPASSSPTLCINSALTAITHNTRGATGIANDGVSGANGLPTGVSASWSSNTITISGTPTASGTFNYSILLTGGCGTVNATGTIIVTPANTAGAASSSPTLCINTALTAITHSTTGATGIANDGVSGANGLPAGVSATWSSNTITISGTPTASGTFNYSILLIGGCGTVNATGTIIVTPANTAGVASSSPTLCINTALTAITHSTTGATGINQDGVDGANGLPAGVSATWSSNTITISGTPTASGTFNYSILLTGGCGTVNATGTITVNPAFTSGAINTTGEIICSGSTPVITIGNTTAASGGDGSITYSWRSSADGYTAAIFGETNVTYLPPSGLTATTSYRRYANDGTCNISPTVSSGTWTVTVDATTVGGSVASNQTICSGTQPSDLTLSGHTGSVIKWESSLDVSFTTPIDILITSTTLTGATIGSLTQDTYFRAVVQNVSCDVEESASVLITVDDAPIAGSVTGGTAICAGSTSGLLTLSGYTGTIIRWEYSISPFTSWTTISNTSATYTSGTLTQTTQFRAVVQNGVCPEAYSASTSVTITTTTWTGGLSGSWDNGTPNDGVKSAVIDSAYTSSGNNIDACALTVNSGATVIISSGDTVSLSGPLTANTGSFVTFNNNANLIQSGTTNTNTGAIIIKRNSSPLYRFDYTLWSSPVANQKLKAFSPGTLDNRFYTHDTATNTYVVVSSPSTTNFSTAKGYLIRMPNTWPLYVNPSPNPQVPGGTPWSGSFTGVPNNGDYTYTLVDGGAALLRYNLVGNPYPSPINATAFVTNSTNFANTTATLYLLRKTNFYTARSSYSTWTTAGYTDNGEPGRTLAGWNEAIQTGQGFIVEASGAGTSLVFDNSMRIDNHDDGFFKNSNNSTTSIERNRIWLNATNSSGSFSQTMVGYITNATNGVDLTIDGKYFNDGELALTSLINAVPFAIQGRSLPFDASDVVPLSFKATTAGNYTIAIDHVDGIFTGGAQSVYLKDNLTTTIHNLNTGAYTFASTAGTFTDRFEVIYTIPLGTNNPIFTANNVIIYNHNNEFVVNTGNVIMSSIKVFDIRGRLIEEKTDINASQTTIKGGLANEVLLVQITNEDGITVTKKVIK